MHAISGGLSVPQGVAKLFDNIATGLQKPSEPRRGTVGQQLSNVSDAKRKIAYDLGVDVYHSNRVLQNELGGLSKAQALGSLGVSLDYGVWTVRAERVVKNTLAGHRAPGRSPAGIELWGTGQVSPLTRRQLEAQGIKVVEHVDRRIGMMD